MKNFGSLIILSATYLLTILIGMQVALVILPLMYPPAGEQPTLPPVVSNPESPTASVQIFVYIIFATIVMLILLKFGLNIIIKIMMSFSILSGLLLTTTLLLDWFGLIVTAVLLILYLLRKNDYNLINTILMLTIAGIGALLGASLSLIPALILLVGLAIYDYIAVYITKHMVTLAQSAKGTMPFMFLIPIGDKQLGLGTGDIAIPLTVAVSVMRDYGVGYAIPTTFGGLLGLVILFFYIQQKKQHAAMPALPPITAGLLFGLGVTMLVLGP